MVLFNWILTSILVSLTAAADSRNERLTPPRGALVVDLSSKFQNSYPNISAAVAALRNTSSPQTIYIAPGPQNKVVGGILLSRAQIPLQPRRSNSSQCRFLLLEG